jgi:phage baseplate assembly protein gpV
MRFPVEGVVTDVDAGKYTCDVQPSDQKLTLLPGCRILTIWATKTARIVALPSVGDKVMVGFENGDHTKSYIEGFISEKGLAGAFLIEAEKARVMIDASGKVVVESAADVEVSCANCSVKASGTIDLGENGAGVVTGGPEGTMPACFVTGAPIPCSSTVKAKR